MDNVNTFNLVTSTATVCIFDPRRLEHRVNDSPDWWSDYMEEIEEVNRGNVMIVGLGRDGSYSASVGTGIEPHGNSVTALLNNESGHVFIGPGEEISGGGFEPTTLRYRTGLLLDLEPATYRVTVAKHKAIELSVQLVKVDLKATNSIENQLLLED